MDETAHRNVHCTNTPLLAPTPHPIKESPGGRDEFHVPAVEAPVAASAAEAQAVRCRSLSGQSPSCQPRPCSVRPPSVVVGAPASPVRGVSRVSRRSSSRRGTQPPVTRRWPAVWRGRRLGHPRPNRRHARAPWAKGSVAALAWQNNASPRS